MASRLLSKASSLSAILSRTATSSYPLGVSRNPFALGIRAKPNQAAYVTASSPTSARAKPKAPVKKANASFKRVKKDKTAENDSASTSGKLNELFYRAAPIVSLNEFLPEAMNEEAIGQMLAIPDDVVAKLEVFGYPKFLNEEFELSKKPSLVVRKSTLDFINIVDPVDSDLNAGTRVGLTGPSGSGKSALLLQAVSFCLSRGWIVVYVPRAINYVNSSYPYSKVQETGEFVQPTLVSSLLQKISKVNAKQLKETPISKSYQFGRHSINLGTSLSELLNIGIADQYAAQKVFEAFLLEVAEQQKIPVLLAIDEVNAFFITTDYNDTDSTPLPASRLSLPRTFLDYLSGKRSLPRGAALGALSNHHSPARSLALDVALRVVPFDPYVRLDTTALRLGQGMTPFPVPAYSKEEARAVLEYYHTLDITYEEPSEDLLNKRFMATVGNPRKFYTACVKNL